MEAERHTVACCVCGDTTWDAFWISGMGAGDEGGTNGSRERAVGTMDVDVGVETHCGFWHRGQSMSSWGRFYGLVICGGNISMGLRCVGSRRQIEGEMLSKCARHENR